MHTYLKVLTAATLLQLAGHIAIGQQKKEGSLLGKTNIHALIEAAPPVPATTPEAVSRTFGAELNSFNTTKLTEFYKPFYDKTESAQKQLHLFYGNKIQQFNEQQGEEGMRKMAITEVDKNPIVSRMGGVDKISKMSEKEAEAAARQAAADMMNSNGNQMPGMNAMMQKYMNDKEFAARFDKMTDKQKEAEMKKFMEAEQKGSSTAFVPTDQKKAQKELAEADKITTAMEINDAIAKMWQQLNQYQTTVDNNITKLKISPGNHAEIEEAHQKALKKLPQVLMGEAGYTYEPVKLRELVLSTAAQHRARNEYELRQISIWFTDLKAKSKLVASDYIDFLAKYSKSINGDMKDMYNGTHTEIPVVNFELTLIEAAAKLGKLSENATKDAAIVEYEQRQKTSAYKP
jgi:hypothetical protein